MNTSQNAALQTLANLSGRRQFLQHSGMGLGAAALGSIVARAQANEASSVDQSAAAEWKTGETA
ncbi:twin-arginine translocation signal domain-containing protein, partial [Rhodopirellula bahusiensis]